MEMSIRVIQKILNIAKKCIWRTLSKGKVDGEK